MVLTALSGALGFLTRLPVGHDQQAWDAFRTTPAAFPLAGYVVGILLAVPFVLPLGAPTVALSFLLTVVGVGGINHLDGVADLGDATAVHGDRTERRAVMKDTTVGVGAVVALLLTFAGLALAGLALARLPALAAAGIVVAAEVAAKLGMAAVACFGTSAHEGLGSKVIGESTPSSFALPTAVAVPAVALTWPRPAASLALLAGLAAALGVLRWAKTNLGGASGDVFGAANEIARVAALHAGVIAWTHF